LIVAAVILGLTPAALFVLRSQVSERTVPSSGRACGIYGCDRAATVVVSKNKPNFGSTYFERQDLCDAHAHQSTWEAMEAGAKFGVFDIVTGARRLDFDQNDEPDRRPERNAADAARIE
jgi:hypothetical protein